MTKDDGGGGGNDSEMLKEEPGKTKGSTAREMEGV